MSKSVAIIGAGPVGLALAAKLASQSDDFRVKVFDPSPAPSVPAATDLRVYALSGASQKLLLDIGAWDAVAPRAACYDRMRVWEAGAEFDAAGALSFDAAQAGVPRLGHIVEDSTLRAALYERLVAAGVECAFEAEVAHVTTESVSAALTLAGGQTESFQLIVGADGAGSRVRESLELAIVTRDYHQRALVAHVSAEFPAPSTAWQRFLPGGPLALLPLFDGRYGLVWSLPEDRAASLAAMKDGELSECLQSNFGDAMGALTLAGPRATFPIRLQHAERYYDRRVVLIGDAAHVIHPMAGQGMNLGLADVAALAQILLSACRRGEDPGDRPVLARYELARRGDNAKMMWFLDGLSRVFDLPPAFAPARRFGTALVDGNEWLKRRLVEQALGASETER